MLIIIMSRSSPKLGHVGLKTRSLGQILAKSCVHSRGHNFDSKFGMVMIIISRSGLKPGHV